MSNRVLQLQESISLVIRPVVSHKDAEMMDNAQKYTINFKEGYRLVFQLYNDGVNADRFVEDYPIEKKDVTKDSKLKASLAKGGGWAAVVRRK